MRESAAEGAPLAGEAVGPVLVGFDGGDGGRDALELARVLGSIKGTRCVVVTALHSGPLPVQRAPGAKGEAELGALLEEAREALGDPSAEGQVIDSLSPAPALIECAQRLGAGTLVVGSPHRGGIGRALLGSVAKQVLHSAPCEVAVAPRGYAATRHEGYGKIAVAFDGTPESELALERAEGLARRAGASIEVLVAEDPVVSDAEAEQAGTGPPSACVLERALRSVDPSLSPRGARLDPGPRRVARTIAAAISQACGPDVDLLVAGSRSPVDRILLGSVTSRLVDASPCPVLVVPHGPQSFSIADRGEER